MRRPEEEDGAEDQEDELYRRFLVGDSLSDADDDEPAQWDSDEAGDEDEDATDASDEEEAEQDAEALALFMDLQRSRARSVTPTPEASSSAAPLFMAHMVRDGSSPLTRRQYLALTAGHSGDVEVESSRGQSTYLQGRGPKADLTCSTLFHVGRRR